MAVSRSRVIKRNERRHQRLRSLNKRATERRRKWFYICETHQNKRSTPIDFTHSFDHSVDEDVS